MSLNFTPQQIKEMGEMWGDVLLPTIPLEKRLAFENPAEVISYLNLKPTEVINLFKQTHQLNPLDILGQFSKEEIEDYLKTLKKG